MQQQDGRDGDITPPGPQEEEPAWLNDPMAASLSPKESLALLAAGQVLHSAPDPDNLFDRTLRRVNQLLEADASSIWLVDETARRLVVQGATGAKGTQLKLFHLDVGQGIVGRVVKEGRLFITNDAAGETSYARDLSRILEYDVRTLICAPLRRGDRILGAVEVLNKSGGRPFTDKDAFLLTVLADVAARAYENARRFQDTRPEP